MVLGTTSRRPSPKLLIPQLDTGNVTSAHLASAPFLRPTRGNVRFRCESSSSPKSAALWCIPT